MKKTLALLTVCAAVLFSSCSNYKSEKTEQKSSGNAKMEEYFKGHNMEAVAEDAVFINMATGDSTKGRKAIGEMLHYLYSVAFDAKADVKHTMITEKTAMLEATFTGKQIGDFAGIAASGKQVNVPLCVIYDLNNEGMIQQARFYLLNDVMMQQLKAN
jgi:predicted ester cyclase